MIADSGRFSRRVSYTDSSPLAGENYYAISAINAAGEGALSPSASAMLLIADRDGNGLIEIDTLEALNNIRYNLEGTSYKVSESDTGSTIGCPTPDGCDGYELTRSLDFADGASYASGEANDDWRPNQANPDDATNSGWEPIGSCNTDTEDSDMARCGDDDDERFAAIFEGNGYTITNLYTRGFGEAGLFGVTFDGAIIRGIGMITSRIYGNDDDGRGRVGALVGLNRGGVIIASYATGTAHGGDGVGDDVGMLVGNNLSEIIASYATGNAHGGDGDDSVGGLVGNNSGTIIASYATGTAHGGDGDGDDSVGGLVGVNNQFIVASYAIGDAHGGDGDSDRVGALVGLHNQPINEITASYGFGTVMGEETRGVDRSDDTDPSIHSPAVLTAATSSTTPANRWSEMAWSFGDNQLYPVVTWITGYDSDTSAFSCEQAMLPAGTTCGDPLPGQHDSDDDGNQDMTPKDSDVPMITSTVSDITVTWTPVTGATAYRVYRNAVAGASELDYRPIATIDSASPLSYTDSSPLAGENYYAISAINAAGEGALSPSASAMLLIADRDGNGLIEIDTLEQLNNIRYNLSGTSYKVSETAIGNDIGCPLPAGCNGYELTRSLDFADGASYASGKVNDDWRPAGGDPDAATNGGWMPIATNSTNLDAVFEGNGNTIANLYSRGDGERGLFGSIGRDATIRNVGIIDGAIYGGDSPDDIGLLAGVNERGTIIASYAAGVADGGDRRDTVGVLVGENSGTIAASYATGNAHGGEGRNTVGGLVGRNSGTIAASYAAGSASGGEGIDTIGGLVGENSGTIAASYATGSADGGGGEDDLAGGLAGRDVDGIINASYGFGAVMGEEIRGVDRSDDSNPSIHSPAVLTAATSSTTLANRWSAMAWSFGDNQLYPVVTWITGYDSDTSAFSCEQAMLPMGVNCDDPIAGQHDSDDDENQDMTPKAPDVPMITSTVSDITVTWTSVTGATAYRVYRNAVAGASELDYRPIATIDSASPLSYTDSSPFVSGNYYAVSAINAAGEGALSPSVNIDLLPIELTSTSMTPFSINESDTMPINIAMIGIDGGVMPAAIDPYIILDGHSGFAIADDGQLTAMIDYEALDSTQQTDGLSIRIQGESSDGRTDVIDLTITITNIDDEAPEFVSFPTTAAIESGAATFQGDAPIIEATDDIGTDIEYAFLQTDGMTTDRIDEFSIAPNTGTITINSAPVYDMDDPAANSHALTIQARDSSLGATGDLVATAVITIVILPERSIELASSAGTAFAINESDDSSIAATTISFDNTALTPATTDPYTILVSPPGVTIDESGMITASVDYEALLPTQRDGGLSIIVQGEDSMGAIGSITLTIMINNIDDEAPEFVSFPETATIESGVAAFQGRVPVIEATDDLGTEIEYAFLSADGTTTETIDGFFIDRNTGAITVTTAPNYFIANSHSLTVRATDISAGAVGDRIVDDDIVIAVLPVVDVDGDGLIDIATLEQLDNIRHNLSGTSYKVSEIDSGLTAGCPLPNGCNGYELIRSLDFADAASYMSDEANDDWRPAGGDPDVATNEGWMPIAITASTSDVVIFEGNGNTIANLYSRGAGVRGLFGRIGRGATIRNVGIIDGAIYGDSSNGDIGFLAGVSKGGTIIASYATGVAHGGDGEDNVGGLVGVNEGGTIVASYAAVIVRGEAGDGDDVGGLVGRNPDGMIIASYATGAANGGTKSDTTGGLVGENTGTIIASYATGAVLSGTGVSDRVGRLTGNSLFGTIIASYGFGETTSARTVDDGGDAPNGVDSATALTLANAGAQWNDAASDTLNVWDFGSSTQPPALRYADYDGADADYDCDMFPATLPGGVAITCGTTLIPGQGR